MGQVLFAGGRLDSVSVTGGAPAEVSTAGRFDATYADAAVDCVAAAGQIQATFVDASNNPVDVTTGQTLYAHFEMYCKAVGPFSTSTNHACLVDSSGNTWLALRHAGSSGLLGLFYNSGTAGAPVWTQIGSGTFSANTSLFVFDLKLTLGSPHSVEWSVGNSVVQSGTFTQASLTTLRGLRLGLSASLVFSQILCTEGKSTIGAKVKYRRATGAGGNSGWSGAATNVNEAVNSDATVDTATSAGLRQTYPMTAVTVPANYAIASIFHFLRAKNDGAAPQNIKSSVRVSTTNYDYGSNMPGIGTSFGPCVARYDTDPSTSAPWSQSGANAAEFGYLSAT